MNEEAMARVGPQRQGGEKILRLFRSDNYVTNKTEITL